MLQARTVKPFTRSAAAPKVQLARRAQLQVCIQSSVVCSKSGPNLAAWRGHKHGRGARRLLASAG